MSDKGREVVANMIGPGVPPGEARRLHDRLVSAVRAEERERICRFIEIHEPVNGTEWTRETVARIRAGAACRKAVEEL